MLLKDKRTGLLVEICHMSELTNPLCRCVHTRKLKGYRHAAIEVVLKTDLVFVSGEVLPHCWSPTAPNDHVDSTHSDSAHPDNAHLDKAHDDISGQQDVASSSTFDPLNTNISA